MIKMFCFALLVSCPVSVGTPLSKKKSPTTPTNIF